MQFSKIIIYTFINTILTKDTLNQNDDTLSQNDDSLSRNDDTLRQNDDRLSQISEEPRISSSPSSYPSSYPRDNSSENASSSYINYLGLYIPIILLF